MKSSSSVGPRRPAFSEFWLSATGTPWLVVSTRPDESTRTRSSGAIVLFLPIGGLPLPTFSEPFVSVTVLDPTIGSGGTIEGPSGGAVAAAGSYSSALFGLNGKLAATSCVPTSFAVSASDELDVNGDCMESGAAGPLTVAR